MTNGSMWRLGLISLFGIAGCRNEAHSGAALAETTRIGQETLDLPTARRAAREVDVLAQLLKMPSDYTREAQIEIDVDNVEDKLGALETEISADTRREAP